MKEGKGKVSGQLVYFISYLCLIYEILLFIVKFKHMEKPDFAVLGMVCLVGGGLWLAWVGGRRFYLPVGSILFITGGYFLLQKTSLFLWLRERLAVFISIESNFNREINPLPEIAFFLSVFCFFLIFILRKGWLFYGYTFSVLLLGPVYGYHPDMMEIFLLFFFHLGNSVYQTVFFARELRKSKLLVQNLVAGQGIVISAVFLFAAFLAAGIIPKNYRKDWMKEAARLQQTWENRTNQNEAEQDPGIVSRRNNYPSGSEQLEVKLSAEPKERLYLKNYTASSYLGNRWKEADETRFYETIRENTKNYGHYYTSPSFFESRQFELVQYGKLREWKAKGRAGQWESTSQMLTAYQKWNGLQTITIKPLTRERREAEYMPYVSSYTSRDSEGGYNFAFYSWEDYLAYYTQAENSTMLWFYDMEQVYQDFVKEEYLSVPKDLLPRLQELCRSHPAQSAEEVTAFILQTLREQASYSLMPGLMPYNMDVAEYFLFEGQSGYCQHFATAAALMYRMYGIPSRYVTGYLAEPENFSLQEDGSYQAVLTDSQTHAWVEIYLGGPGWIPVEVTPPSEEWLRPAGTSSLQEKMMEESKEIQEEENEEEETFFSHEEKALSAQKESREEQVRKDSAKKDSEESSEETFTSFHFLHYWEKNKKLLGIWAGILLIFLILTKWKSSYQKQRFLQLGADEVYQKIVLLLHTNAKLKEWDGMEPDFVSAAAKEWKNIPKEELEQIQNIALKEAFGRELPSKEEQTIVRKGYEQMYCRIKRQLKGKEKVMFCLHMEKSEKGRKRNGDKQRKGMDGIA